MLVEVTLRASSGCADSLSDALLEHGALSVSIEDARADTIDEQTLYGEPGCEPTPTAWRDSRVRMLAAVEHADAIVRAACAVLKAPLVIEHRRVVADIDWVRATQAQFAPICVSQRLWIVPSWHQPPQPDAVVVRLDPGVAFGTGTHSTTRLCLAWLDENLRPGASVLDYGCGSGILAITAAKLGASAVAGVDIDPQALDAARCNARANAVSASYTDPDGLSPGATYDIVLANILSNPLKLLAPVLVARVAPGGSLVLSGVLQRQAGVLISTYRATDPAITLSVWRSQDGWVCLAGARTASHPPREH